MLKTSWALDQVISQWSFSSHKFYLLLEGRTFTFSKLNSWLYNTTPVSVLPLQLFPVVEQAVCADCLWFWCTLLFCFGFVLHFLCSPLSLGYVGACQFEVWFLWLVSVFSYLQQCLANCRVLFLENAISRSDFFHNLVFWVNRPKSSCHLQLEHKQSQNFCWWA